MITQGITEMGAYGFECAAQAGLHVNGSQFIAEEAVRVDLGIRVEVVSVPAQSLPRYERKARRLVRRAGSP